MEYKNIYYSIFAFAGLLIWSLEYFKVFSKAQLALPNKFSPKSWGSYTRIPIFIVGLAGWLCLAMAITGPRKALKLMPGSIEVNDIFVVLDVSLSMLADDLPPNRLEAAKEKLRQFAQMKPTDRIGVIIFSEKVYTLLPLTTDPKLIDQILSEITIDNNFLGSGTNIGDAIGLAVARAEASDTENRVIILLTDGVSNVDSITPVQAAEIAKDFGIKIYTIGIGTDGSARLPIRRGAFGVQYQTIPGGSIDMKTLKKISDMTGGKSYLANSEGSLNEILQDIEKLERTKVKSHSRVIYEELFMLYLIPGVLLLLLTEFVRRFIIREVI